MARARRSRSSEPVERPADLDPHPFPPMEAELVRELPEGDEWQYEPKWDGFRGLLENASGGLRLWSRNARPLLRYFPELAPLGELLPPRTCLDGEIVIVRDGVLDFDAMQTRLHPPRAACESFPRRFRRRSSPSTCSSGTASSSGGAARLAPGEAGRAGALLRPVPLHGDSDEALEWLEAFESIGLDGVIAKRRDEPYARASVARS